MAVNTTPIFVLTPICAAGQVSTANTNRDGTGTLATILTAGASGCRIDRVTAHAIVTTTAGMVRLYVDDGVTVRLVAEISIAANTVAAAVPGYEAEWSRQDGQPVLVLPAGVILKASTHNAEAINVIAHGGQFA